MGITKFIYILLAMSLVLLFPSSKQPIKTKDLKEQPKVSFFDATMYEITNTMVKTIVQAKKMLMYKNKEELYDATIVLKQDDNSGNINTISALNIIKTKNDIEFTDNVNLQSSNKVNIRTQQLHYNILTDVIINNTDFVARYNSNSLYGDNLYYNSKINHFIAKNTKFRIKVRDEQY